MQMDVQVIKLINGSYILFNLPWKFAPGWKAGEVKGLESFLDDA
jgi:hypothetical protein